MSLKNELASEALHIFVQCLFSKQWVSRLDDFKVALNRNAVRMVVRGVPRVDLLGGKACLLICKHGHFTPTREIQATRKGTSP